MKRTITLTAVLLGVCGILAAQAPSPYRGTLVRPLYDAVAADDTDKMIVIKYIGDQSHQAHVLSITSATSVIAFTYDAVADTTINSTGAICGAAIGSLDGTVAACDTVGEMVDVINLSAHWRAMPLDSLRSDPLTADIMATAGDCNAKQPDGCPVYRDTNGATLWHFTRALVQCRVASCLWPGGGAPNTNQNPYQGTYSVLNTWYYRTTYGGGTSVVRVYAVTPASAGAGETVTTLYAGTAAATNTFQLLGVGVWPYGLIGPPNAKLVLRVINDNSMSAVEGYAYGYLFRY
jgi:hypothetical protein